MRKRFVAARATTQTVAMAALQLQLVYRFAISSIQIQVG
jgi:hypothetical protein